MSSTHAIQVAHLLYDINGIYLKGLEQMMAKAFESLKKITENQLEYRIWTISGIIFGAVLTRTKIMFDGDISRL